MPGCHLRLTPEIGDNIGHVGEAAHIEGENGGKGNKQQSARYNPDMTDDERNHYNNLIYLCGTCHHIIDTIPDGESAYPVARLQTIKREHEAKVRQAVVAAFAKVGFAELQEVTAWAQRVTSLVQSSDFELTKLEDKIAKNELSPGCRMVISMGLGVARDVRAFINTLAQTDPEFPERLACGFKTKYLALRKDGLRGEDLFDMMCSFSQQGFEKQVQRSAGLAVLVYLFEACEVFEK